MKIELDVAAITQRWSNSLAFTRIIQAVCLAEGNILKAVQCTYPHVTTRTEAIEILCRSCTHAMADFITERVFDCTNDDGDATGDRWNVLVAFIHFWAARWAPVGVTNDPSNLNKNWPVNVLKILRNP